MRRNVVALVVLGLLAAAVGPAQAKDFREGQEHESRILSDRWNIVLGAVFPEFTTSAAIGSKSLLGTIIRLEDTLGLDEDLGVGRLGGFYRFSKKHSIQWDIMQLNRDASRVVGDQFTILDPPLTFAAAARVDSEFENTIFSLSYRHSFINNGKTEAGFSAGLGTFGFDLSLAGVAAFRDNNGMIQMGQASGSVSIVAPVPNFGMYINHAFTKKWILRMRAGFLDISFGDYEGSFLDTSITIDWIFTRHFGLGAGFVRSDLTFDNTGEDPFKIEYKLGGPTVYVSLVF